MSIATPQRILAAGAQKGFMFFFKYQKAGIVERNMLRRGEVFFASRSELNDANEFQSRFILRGSLDHWERLAEYILVKVSMETEEHGASKESAEKLIGIANDFGQLLKRKSGNRDLPLEALGGYAVEMLRDKIESLFGDHNGQVILSLLCSFCDRGLLDLLDVPRYVTSFSLDGANPTMWGHYGDAERGFAVIYESPEPVLNVHAYVKMLPSVRRRDDGINTIGVFDRDSLPLEPVRYRRTPPKVNAFRDLSRRFFYSDEEHHYDVPEDFAGSPDLKEEALLGVVKSLGWKYEQEIRAFLPMNREMLPAMRVLRVATKQIRGLIFGPKTTEDIKADLVQCCHLMRESFTATKDAIERLPDFAFFQSRSLASRFGMEFEPVGILGSQMYGRRIPLIPFDQLPAEPAESLNIVARQISFPSKLDPNLIDNLRDKITPEEL